MSEPLVSIVIPVYNGGNYLHEAIDSALSQVYPHCEVLVVNDGSDDGGATEAIALSYGARIRYFAKANGGVASALNLGIQQMRGELFSWLSHDDVYLPAKCLAQVELYRQAGDKNAVIYADADSIDAHGQRTCGKTAQEVSKDDAFCRIWGWSFLNGCTMLLPRHLLLGMGGFREDLATTQDYDLWLRMAHMVTFHHLPQVVLLSRQHGGQGSKTPLHRRECTELFSAYVPQLLESARGFRGGFTAATPLLARAVLHRSTDYGLVCARSLWKAFARHATQSERRRLFFHMLIRSPQAYMRLLWLQLPQSLRSWVRGVRHSLAGQVK